MSNQIVDKTVNSVFKTFDYDKFKTMSSNRNIDSMNLMRLEREMTKRQYATPIIVNENFEVIDGQHRLVVCKNNNLPVYYMVVRGLKEDDCRKLNQNQKEWSTMDYMKFFAKMGSGSAKRILELSEQFDVSARQIIAACGKSVEVVKGIKNGDSEYDWMTDSIFSTADFDLAKDRLIKANRIATILSAGQKRISRAHIIIGFIQCAKADGFDYNRLVRGCEESGSQYSWKVPSRVVVENFCKIYNRGYRKGFMDMQSKSVGYKVTFGNDDNRWR